MISSRYLGHWVGFATNESNARTPVAADAMTSGRHSTPDDEPEQAHSRRDLRQQDERPRRWMAKADDDGRREEDLDVAGIDLGRNGHEEQDGDVSGPAR